MVKKIYLHWTAGRYDQLFNDYHICIDGDGVVHKMADFETKLAHTWKRNSNAIGIALCCCYGAELDGYRQVHWGDYPPTDDQIMSMAICIARICKEYNIEITKETVMTHAEIAEIDDYGVNGSDPDMRWDLLTLPDYNGSGGDIIREFAADIIHGGTIYGITFANFKGNM